MKAIAKQEGIDRRQVRNAISSPQYLKNLSKKKLAMGVKAMGAADTALTIANKHLTKLKRQKDPLSAQDIRHVGRVFRDLAEGGVELLGSAVEDAQIEDDLELAAIIKKKAAEKLAERKPSIQIDGHG